MPLLSQFLFVSSYWKCRFLLEMNKVDRIYAEVTGGWANIQPVNHHMQNQFDVQ